jgi:hypothetical protein
MNNSGTTNNSIKEEMFRELYRQGRLTIFTQKK